MQKRTFSTRHKVEGNLFLQHYVIVRGAWAQKYRDKPSLSADSGESVEPSLRHNETWLKGKCLRAEVKRRPRNISALSKAVDEQTQIMNIF